VDVQGTVLTLGGVDKVAFDDHGCLLVVGSYATIIQEKCPRAKEFRLARIHKNTEKNLWKVREFLWEGRRGLLFL